MAQQTWSTYALSDAQKVKQKADNEVGRPSPVVKLGPTLAYSTRGIWQSYRYTGVDPYLVATGSKALKESH